MLPCALAVSLSAQAMHTPSCEKPTHNALYAHAVRLSLCVQHTQPGRLCLREGSPARERACSCGSLVCVCDLAQQSVYQRQLQCGEQQTTSARESLLFALSLIITLCGLCVRVCARERERAQRGLALCAQPAYGKTAVSG